MKRKIIQGVISIAFYALMFYVISSYVFAPIIKAILKAKYGSMDSVPSNIKDITNVLYELIVYGCIIVGLIFVYKPEIKEDLLEEQKDTNNFSKYVLFGIVLLYASNIVVNIITNKFDVGQSENQSEIEKMLSSNNVFNIIILILVIGFIGPLTEELIYRKSFFNVIPNQIAALVVSSTVFGLIHVITSDVSFKNMIVLWLPYFSSGLVFGITYIKSKEQIFAPFLVHSISNILSLVLIICLK